MLSQLLSPEQLVPVAFQVVQDEFCFLVDLIATVIGTDEDAILLGQLPELNGDSLPAFEFDFRNQLWLIKTVFWHCLLYTSDAADE